MKNFYVRVVRVQGGYFENQLVRELVLDGQIIFSTYEEALAFVRENFSWVASSYDIEIVHITDGGQVTVVETVKL